MLPFTTISKYQQNMCQCAIQLYADIDKGLMMRCIRHKSFSTRVSA